MPTSTLIVDWAHVVTMTELACTIILWACSHMLWIKTAGHKVKYGSPLAGIALKKMLLHVVFTKMRHIMSLLWSLFVMPRVDLDILGWECEKASKKARKVLSLTNKTEQEIDHNWYFQAKFFSEWLEFIFHQFGKHKGLKFVWRLQSDEYCHNYYLLGFPKKINRIGKFCQTETAS